MKGHYSTTHFLFSWDISSPPLQFFIQSGPPCCTNGFECSRRRKVCVEIILKIPKETELATRTNKKPTDKINGVGAKPSRGPAFAAKKATCIEQSKQHERDLREREKQRVAQLEKMARIVRVGDAIQNGVDA